MEAWNSRMNIILLSLVLAGIPQSVDDIVAKHIEARGGATKFAAIQSMKLTGRIKFGVRDFVPLTVHATASGKFRLEIPALSALQIFDGKTAWNGDQAVDGDFATQILDQAGSAIGGPLWDSKKRGIALESGGRVTWKDHEVILVKATLPTGTRMNIYLDPATYLETGEELFVKIQGKDAVIEETVSDDKRFGGVLFPCVYVSGPKGEPPNNRLEVLNVDINPKLDAAVFRPPSAK